MSSGSGPNLFGADNQQIYLFGGSWPCRKLVQATCLQYQGAGIFLCALSCVGRRCGCQGAGGRCHEGRGPGASVGGKHRKNCVHDVGASGGKREGDRASS